MKPILEFQCRECGEVVDVSRQYGSEKKGMIVPYWNQYCANHKKPIQIELDKLQERLAEKYIHQFEKEEHKSIMTFHEDIKEQVWGNTNQYEEFGHLYYT